MNKLDAFVQEITADKTEFALFTNTTHEKFAKKQMDSVIDEYPKYQNAMISLALYPLQEWASISRKKLKIDKSSNQELLGCICKNVDIQEKAIKLTEETINLCKGGISKAEILQAVHQREGEECKMSSQYYLNLYYYKALLSFGKKNFAKFNKIYRSINSLSSALDEDTRTVFHQIEYLIGLIHELKREYYHLYQVLLVIIEELKTYPSRDANNLYIVMFLWIGGFNEVQIAKKIGKSRTYVRSKKQEGSKAVSYVLWGYTTRQILIL